MKPILALDLSSKPGIAFFLDGKLKRCETIFLNHRAADFGAYPFSYVKYAELIADKIIIVADLLYTNHPDMEVVIEETTAGRNNYSQKLLEFVHFCVLKELRELKVPISYVRTGVWRKAVGGNLNPDEKKLNVKVRAIKKQTNKKLAKIDGKVVGKVTRKHSSLRCFKEHFGIEKQLKDNDAVEAALLGLAFLMGVPVCDGTTKGGTTGS